MSDALQPLAELLQLQRRMRALDSREALAFFIVNETHRLTPYRQALLWDAAAGKLRTVSGIASLDEHSPFCRGFGELCSQWQRRYRQIQPLTPQALPTQERIFWKEYLPEHGLWLPLPHSHAENPLVLILLRERPWSDTERMLLEQLADAYGHAWHAVAPRRARRVLPVRRKKTFVITIMVLALAMLFPVRQSVLAPAEVVAHRPVMVRAPLAGVIDDIPVRPNQPVKQGQVLVRLDARDLENQRENARQQFASADAQYRQAQQMALNDTDAKAQLAVLASRRQQAQIDMAFLEAQLARMESASPRDGVAIFDDVSDLLGRSVSVGERIMMVADPHDAELEIQLPATDAIALDHDAEVRLFLNVAPNSPQPAYLTQIGYRASLNADNVMAYRLHARFQRDDPILRVGLKGTAKVYGYRTVLIAYLLRKPWSSLRVWLGV
ncbi:efflux RND transporter periplasmic adaptor subunit (plasmid) [Klebsiella sp. WOUb02]|uniref:efflux RND transporter periplasmic adaptor subunit n=1 Tax=Klebsiella sp. WOUb02 TaxID=3161071 RepID=UPI003CEF5758